jgi:delta-aminolevulinic acid dehydratase/porphobilinogen synthase
MPGQKRHSLAGMMREVEEAMRVGVKTFVLFPKVTGVEERRARRRTHQHTHVRQHPTPATLP